MACPELNKEVSAEGWAIDGAIDSLTRGVLTGRVSKAEAEKVLDLLMKTSVGEAAEKEYRDAVDRFVASRS